MKKRGLSLLLALSVAIGLLTVTAGAETQSSEVANFTATTSILYQTHINENFTGLLVEATGIPANAEYGVEIAVVPVETEGEGVEPTEVAIDAAEVTGTKYPATSDLIAGKYIVDLVGLDAGASYTATPYYTTGDGTVYAEEFSFTTVAARSPVSSGYHDRDYYAYNGNLIAIGYGDESYGNGGAVDFMGNNNGWLGSTYEDGGWAYKFGNSDWVETYGPKVSVYKNSDVQVNSPVQAWVVPTTTENGAFGVLTYYIRNISDTTITNFRFGAAADIMIGSVDSAPISRREYGIIMKDNDNNAFIMICREGFNGIETGKGVSTLWFGEFDYAKSNVFENTTDDDLTDGTDSGAAYSWTIGSLASGQIETFSVMFGIGDADTLEGMIKGSVDYENEQLKELEPSTAYTITAGGNDYTFVLDAQTTTIPLAGTDKNGNAYDFVGKTITITSNAEGSQPQTIIVANRPVAEDPAPPHPTSPLYTTPDAVPPSDVTTDTDSITVTDNTQEYTIDGGTTWVAPTNGKVVFENLTPGGTYTLKARVPATTSAPASAPSDGITVKTLGLIKVTGLSQVLTYNGNDQQAAGITVTDPAAGATIKYAAEASDEYSLEAPPAYTYPGNYTYYYRVEAEGYRPAYGSVSVTVNKATYAGTTSAYGNILYLQNSTFEAGNLVPENAGTVTLPESNSLFNARYDADTKKIVVTTAQTLNINSHNTNQTFNVTVKSPYYYDYTVTFTLKPLFRPLESELPVVSNPKDYVMRIDGILDNIAIRLLKDGVPFTEWVEGDEIGDPVYIDPLHADDGYSVEACYVAAIDGSGNVSPDCVATAKWSDATPGDLSDDWTISGTDEVVTEIDLATCPDNAVISGEFKAFYDFFAGGESNPTLLTGKYITVDGGTTWKKLAETLVVTTSAATDKDIDVGSVVGVPYGSHNLILDGVKTSGTIYTSPYTPGNITIKGDVSVGGIMGCAYGEKLTIAGTGNNATLTMPDSVGIYANGELEVKNLAKLAINSEHGAVYGADDVKLTNIRTMEIVVSGDDEIGISSLNGSILFTDVFGTVDMQGSNSKVLVLSDPTDKIVVNNTATSYVRSGANANDLAHVTRTFDNTQDPPVFGLVPVEEIDAYLSITRVPTGSLSTPVTTPVSNDETSVNVQASVSENDATIKPLDDKQIEQLVGDENASGDVVVDLTNLGRTIDTVGIPKETLEAIVEAAEDAGNDTEHLVIKLSTAELKLDDAAMRAIVDQSNGDIIKFNFDDVGTARLNYAQKEAVKDMDVRKGYDAYITVNGQRVSDFKGGEVEIIVPYAVPAGENVADFSVWYIDEQGNLEKQTSTYDGKHKWFVVTHFSDYVIVYDGEKATVADCPKDDTCPIHPFTDTDKQAWYHDGVHYCIDNELMIGVGNNLFAPTGITTRAQIVTILWRMEGSPLVEAAEDFNDVYESDWYYNAIRWASANKVVEGYGNSVFGPNDTITREQVATILWRYCKYKGIDVSVGEETNILSYEDAFDVSDWAMEAMQWACGSGLIQGIEKNNTKYLDPQGNADRSQSATMIYRFCTEIKK